MEKGRDIPSLSNRSVGERRELSYSEVRGEARPKMVLL